MKQSVSIIGRLGTIVPLNDDDKAPFMIDFIWVGPETLRGYDYRDIGPRTTEGLNTETAGGAYLWIILYRIYVSGFRWFRSCCIL